MAGEPSDTGGPPDGDTEDDAPAVTGADELFWNGPEPPVADAGETHDETDGPTESDAGPAGTEVSVQVESPTDRQGDADPDESGAETTVTSGSATSTPDRATRPGDRERSVDRSRGADRDGSVDRSRDREEGNGTSRGRGSPRSEQELEREILDAEERIGPDEDHCRHCGAVFHVREDSCPDCGSPHPRSVDPPASTKKRPQVAAALSLLLPGAGHLYNEQFGRGALAFFGTVLLVAGIAFFGLLVNVLVTVASLGTLSALGTLILVLALLFGWFLPVSVAAWDAYGQAVELNAG